MKPTFDLEAAVLMRWEGKRNKEIADHFQRDLHYVCEALESPTAIALKRGLDQRFLGALATKGVKAATKALETLEDLLQSDNEQMRFKAANSILDRFGAAREAHVHVGHSHNVRLDLSKMSMAQIRELRGGNVMDVDGQSIAISSNREITDEKGGGPP